MLGYATGLVHPTQGGWYLENPIELSFPDGRWKLLVRESRFHVFIEGTEPADIGTYRNEIASIVQGCLDGVSFWLAAPLRVEVTALVIDGNRLILSTMRWPEVLDDPAKTTVTSEELQPFVNAAWAEPLARAAMADLRSAIELPDDTLFLSYRAVESVRQWFIGDNEEDDGKARQMSWLKLRTELLVSESDCRRLSFLAAARRHGKSVPPTESERLEALRLARAIVARFVAYLEQRRIERAGMQSGT